VLNFGIIFSIWIFQDNVSLACIPRNLTPDIAVILLLLYVILISVKGSVLVVNTT
jgi:hypothetical protein